MRTMLTAAPVFRALTRTTLVLAVLAGTGGAALAAKGANADGNGGQPRAAYAAAPRDAGTGAMNQGAAATNEANGDRRGASSWFTPSLSPGAESALLDAGGNGDH